MNLIRKNILWLLVSQTATWFATLVALVVVPNKLGSTDFGTLGFAFGYVSFFTLAAGLGTGLFLSRAIARDHSLAGPYVWNALLLKLAVWAVLAPAALLIAAALGNRGQTLLLIAIACVGMLPYLLSEVFGAALGGMQRMAKPAMWGAGQIYFQTVFGIAVLVAGGSVVAYAMVLVLAPFIPMLATGWMVHPFVRGHRVLEFRIWRLLVVGGVPLLALAFLNMISGSLDVPILHALVGSEPVGWYTVALRWVGIPIFITTAVVTAYFPNFSAHGNPVTEEFAPLVNRAVRIVLLVTIPASVGLIFTADNVMRLIYNGKFDSSIVLIQILAVGLPVIALDTVLATALIAANRVRGYLGVAAIAAILNPIACLILITLTDSRYGNGAIGASIATVLTELWILVGALYFRSPGVLDRAEVGRIGRIVAASAAMLPFLMVAAPWPLAVQLLIGVAVYGIASLAVRSVTLSELRQEVQRMTGRRRQDRPGGDGNDGRGGQLDEEGVDDGTYSGLASARPLGDVPPW